MTVGLSAELTIYDGGAGRLGIDAAKEQVLAVRQGLVGVEHQVLLGAVRAYVQLRLSQDVVALRQGNVRVLERELEAAQDRFDLGEITRTDVAIAEARLAAARAQLAAAEGDVLVNRESYELAIGRKPGNLSVPPRASTSLSGSASTNWQPPRSTFSVPRHEWGRASACGRTLARTTLACRPIRCR